MKKFISISTLSVIVVAIATAVFAENATQSPEVRLLERRVAQLEQRLSSIELNISRVEQSVLSQRSQANQPGARDQEMNLMREEIRNLTERLSATECGLLKLDERTAIRKSTGARANDPCRLNPNAPLSLSARP
jgi:peptidoglycan hydrolase CwlO-like protein